MNTLYVYTSLYNFFRNYKFLPWWFFTPMRRLTRFLSNRYLPNYLRKSNYKRHRVEYCLIVSLTSFPDRINDVWMVIECLKRQTVLPEKIILWLSKKQFPTKEDIPRSLWNEEDGLFEIRMVDDDIRSHKKYYYVLEEYPEKTIVTCDDDIFYHPKMIEKLIQSSHLFRGCIVSNVCLRLSYGLNGKLLPYLQWSNAVNSHDSDDLVQIGLGGVLYPPSSLDEMVLDKELFLRLTPLADDLWLNCMARKKGTLVVKSQFKYQPLPILNDAPTLTSINCGEYKNDEQMLAICAYFKNNRMKDLY